MGGRGGYWIEKRRKGILARWFCLRGKKSGSEKKCGRIGVFLLGRAVDCWIDVLQIGEDLDCKIL